MVTTPARAFVQRERHFLLWAAFFIVANLLHPQHGGVNPAARWATLSAMSQRGTFEIATPLLVEKTADGKFLLPPGSEKTNTVETTVDWSKSPDGKYYANKAPGPAFIAFPFVWIADRIRGGDAF